MFNHQSAKYCQALESDQVEVATLSASEFYCVPAGLSLGCSTNTCLRKRAQRVLVCYACGPYVDHKAPRLFFGTVNTEVSYGRKESKIRFQVGIFLRYHSIQGSPAFRAYARMHTSVLFVQRIPIVSRVGQISLSTSNSTKKFKEWKCPVL